MLIPIFLPLVSAFKAIPDDCKGKMLKYCNFIYIVLYNSYFNTTKITISITTLLMSVWKLTSLMWLFQPIHLNSLQYLNQPPPQLLLQLQLQDLEKPQPQLLQQQQPQLLDLDKLYQPQSNQAEKLKHRSSWTKQLLKQR